MNACRTRIVVRYSVLALACMALVTPEILASGWDVIDRPSREQVPLPKGITFEAAKLSVTDPLGDTFGAAQPQIDAAGFSNDVGGGNVVLGITFAGTISPPNSGQANAVSGFIDIDTDQNGATGGLPMVDFLAGMQGNSGLGIEYFVDLLSYSAVDGSADVVSDSGGPVGRAPVAFTASSLTVTIPLALLGGDDGVVNAAAVVGPDAGPTDRVPNNGSVAGGGPSTSILLNNDRFRVSVSWSRPPDFPEGPAFVSSLRTDDSGIFYFLDPNNLEFLVKVLNGCAVTNHYWVFFAATTDVEFTVTVTDTQSNQTRTYNNPLGQPADAITDTTAFPTCP